MTLPRVAASFCLVGLLLCSCVPTSPTNHGEPTDPDGTYYSLDSALRSNPRDRVQWLYLNRQMYDSIPLQVTLLPNLRTLVMNENRIKNIPDFLSRTRISALYLRYNQLDSINTVALPISLRELYLSDNKIRRMPHVLTRLRGLSHLDLAGNYLTDLPSGFAILADSLTNLKLGSNLLQQIPDELLLLQNLKILDWENNRLRSLPDSIQRWRKLEVLSVSDNWISSMPDALCDMSSLSTLSVRNNLLSKLPQKISQLVHLGRLDVRENPIPLEEIRRLLVALPKTTIYYE